MKCGRSKEGRTEVLIKKFDELYSNGMSVSEIADSLGVSKWTVYHYLSEIAAANGKSRTEYLTRPFIKSGAKENRRKKVHRLAVDIEGCLQAISDSEQVISMAEKMSAKAEEIIAHKNMEEN